MDQARASPSVVEVPLPISSIITREEGVADEIMLAVSTISTMKVDLSFARSSLAPTLLTNVNKNTG